MREGFIERFISKVQNRLIIAFGLMGIFLAVINWLTYKYLSNDIFVMTVIMTGSSLIVSISLGLAIGKSLTKPTKYLAQAILHVSPSDHLTNAPNLDELKLGKELVSTLTRQVYDYAALTKDSSTETKPFTNELLDQIPNPVIGLDEKGTIIMSNSLASKTLQIDKLIGESFDKLFKIYTPEQNDSPILEWINESQNSSVTSNKTWQKLEIKPLNSGVLGYFDVAASFNKHSASGIETILTLYDHSEAYTSETTSIDFIALAVHELRTPITILRGYIEAFEEELDTTATPEAKDFLKKMNSSAQNLTTFISNLLNVAKINQDQLHLNLSKGDWSKVLPEVVDGLRNKAETHGKQLELRMESNLPEVAIDRLTISEVITNLIDNAIKYSPDSAPNIAIVSKLDNDGRIETTIKDHGVGIPSSVMPHLFNKFSRNHRNKTKVGGTGLGLFLSKAIVNAHYGNIWANSKEGQGSTFGFTILPYSQLAKELQNNNNSDIVRTPHGWIKNHSMHRR